MTNEAIEAVKLGDVLIYGGRAWRVNAIRPGAALGITLPEFHLVPTAEWPGDPAQLSVWISSNNPGLAKEV